MNQKTINAAMRAIAKRPRGKRSPAAAEQCRRAAKARWVKRPKA